MHAQKSHLRTIAATIVAALVLVAGLDMVSYAATGKSMLLGKINKAGGPTSLTNTGTGPALNLTNKPAFPPLKVSSSTKVARLNADLLDGLNASALQDQTTFIYGFGTAAANVPAYPTMSVPLAAGVYRVSMQMAVQAEAAGADLNCYIFPEQQVLTSGNYTNLLGTTTNKAFQPLVVEGIIVMPANDNLAWGCDGAVASYTFWSPGRVTVQKLVKTSSSAVTPSARSSQRMLKTH